MAIDRLEKIRKEERYQRMNTVDLVEIRSNRYKKEICDKCIERAKRQISAEQLKRAEELGLFEILEEAYFKGMEGIIITGRKSEYQ